MQKQVIFALILALVLSIGAFAQVGVINNTGSVPNITVAQEVVFAEANSGTLVRASANGMYIPSFRTSFKPREINAVTVLKDGTAMVLGSRSLFVHSPVRGGDYPFGGKSFQRAIVGWPLAIKDVEGKTWELGLYLNGGFFAQPAPQQQVSEMQDSNPAIVYQQDTTSFGTIRIISGPSLAMGSYLVCQSTGLNVPVMVSRDVSISTFGDIAYLVESELTLLEEHRDFISVINLRDGKKSVFLSLTEAQKMFGVPNPKITLASIN